MLNFAGWMRGLLGTGVMFPQGRVDSATPSKMIAARQWRPPFAVRLLSRRTANPARQVFAVE
ncbi:hypothetical protein C7I87_16695 [Mesorhizobium sp. SARCC-RB16n]|uniref:hypothetical protein n=1 Tax=Mesorhizobium sp. SARCC-RB16n TaxID=2116687 RepID=UPI00122F8FA5|nr:hypothetical protein [Mesorhizobium sp. SARCC-RB16n]KAA3449587.1 hypothetical protein C7I87_16695 [Mesorhizobium sp. SARCC-RB16n]